MVGFCEIAFLFVPTTILYVLLGIPSVWETFLPGSALLGVDTLLGR
jgi:amino acid transporter, AAT family